MKIDLEDALWSKVKRYADTAGYSSPEEFVQKHYKELTPIDLQIILSRLEKDTKEQYGADVTIKDYKPQEGVKFGYALNLSVHTISASR